MSIPDVLKKISVEGYHWRNATKNVEAWPDRFFHPKNKEDISAIIQYAEQEGKRVRAVGSGHSYSEAAKGDDFLLSMLKLKGVSQTPPETLRAEHQSSLLVNVQAGTIVHDLNCELDKMGLALPNMGAVDFQTISGALMTGTHGSGIAKPTFPDMIRSIRLVGEGGRYIQIEPENGITDPDLPQDSGLTELIQDDDTFYSAVLSFGAMGIVYELTLEVTEAFWMKEKRYLTNWKALRADILEGRFLDLVQNVDFAGFRVNPYPIDGIHLCSIVEQEIIDKKDRPKGLNARMKNILGSLGGKLGIIIDKTIRALNRDPSKAPRRIQTALKSTIDKRFTGKSFKLLFQSGRALAGRGVSAEFAFEVKPDLLVGAIETSFQIVDQLAKEHNYYQSSFVSVRFTPSSKVLLSPNFGRPTFYLDVPLLRGTPGDDEILAEYQRRMMSMGGIPHWGKINEQLHEGSSFLEETYGARLETWRDVQKQLDPMRTFLNDFTKRMGLSPKPAQA